MESVKQTAENMIAELKEAIKDLELIANEREKDGIHERFRSALNFMRDAEKHFNQEYQYWIERTIRG